MSAKEVLGNCLDAGLTVSVVEKAGSCLELGRAQGIMMLGTLRILGLAELW